MPEPTLQDLMDRITRLEEEVRGIRAEVFKGEEQADKPWWKKIAGRHKNSEVFAEIVRLGREIREAERPKERGNGVKPKKARSRRPQRAGSKG